MVLFQEVTKRYPHRPSPVLEEVDLRVPPGQFVFVSGASGAGKTTLLRLMFGAILPTSGLVRVGGADLGRLPRRRIPLLRRRLGVIFQDFKLVPGMTVRQNVALPLEVAGIRGADLRRKVAAALERVGLEGVAAAPAQTLSGGEQQRAAVARALVGQPRLILADEPTGNLDPDNAREVMRLLFAAHAAGATVMVATHDPELMGQAPGARVVHLADGRLEPA